LATGVATRAQRKRRNGDNDITELRLSPHKRRHDNGRDPTKNHQKFAIFTGINS